jgi:hypothetical protein
LEEKLEEKKGEKKGVTDETIFFKNRAVGIYFVPVVDWEKKKREGRGEV